MVNLIRDLPAVQRRAPLGEDLTRMRCACDKLVNVVDMQPIFTGVLNALDNTCTGCRKEAAGLSIIVCARCRRVVARMAPHADKLGFRFHPNRCYHVLYCGGCIREGEEPASDIQEQALHHRALGMKK